jgi:Cu2+-exporting ATPase
MNRTPTTDHEHTHPGADHQPDRALDYQHEAGPEGQADHEAHEEHGGHDHGGHGDHAAMFRRKFWLSLVLTIPVVLYSHMWMTLTDLEPPSFTGDHWVAPILGTLVFLYGGPVFLTSGWAELKSRRPGMMLLISMGLLVAFGASVATQLDLIDVDLWPELATLVTIMLLGHWQEMKAIGQAEGALAALAELLPDDAERITDDGTEIVNLNDLRTGDVVLVRAGGRVPADGVIVDGEAELDESMVTGESRPVAKQTGDKVVAGTVSTDSSIRVRVEAVGEDTALAGIQRLVADAQASHSRAQALADRAAALLFYVAAASGAFTLLVWSLLGQTDDALTRTVTVLVIACPHALGLAIPLVISLSTAISARAGILVKDRLALERMRSVDVVLFDKTGTLTRGEHVVTGTAAVEGSDDELLRLAAAVESDSEHPLARAIVSAAQARGSVSGASDFRALTGRGVEATVDGQPAAVGGPALLRQRQLSEPSGLQSRLDEWRGRGAAVLYVLRGDRIVGALALEDEIRAESRQAVDDLHRLGVRVAMITGDAKQVADAVGEELGIDEVFAEVLPEDKDRAVAELQERGQQVAMVGDGVNDAPALARADVGLAIGAGTDVAIESAGVVLASSDPRSVIGVIRLSRASYAKMIQNLAWGAGYNVFAIPLAAGVLASAGFTLSPAVGAILMSLSTIVVALNAQLLRRLDLRPTPLGGDANVPAATAVGPLQRKPALTIAAVVAALVLIAGTAVAIATRDDGGSTADETATSELAATGLSITDAGYTLVPEDTVLVPGRPNDFRFRITGPDGQTVQDLQTEHERELHLIVVSRDLVHFQHVHPTEETDGSWHIPLRLPEAGSYRAYADIRPEGRKQSLTLATDLSVAGNFQPRALPAVDSTARVGEFDVRLSGNPAAGREADVAFNLRRDGQPVTDLDPYLGAYGHLVAIRTGDLGYLHVHPKGAEPTGSASGGPDIHFGVDVPSVGTYRLFLDFSHGGGVRTAAFTVDVPAETQQPEATEPAPAQRDAGDEHGGH